MRRLHISRGVIWLAAGMIILLLVAGYWLYRRHANTVVRASRVFAWLRNPDSHTDWVIRAGDRCGEAPFAFPTSGLIGFLWDDSFRLGAHHQGIDIFGGEDLNVAPVIAAYSGYLTRQPDWKASIIIRIPDDPLHPGQQIWTYYTHMADEAGNSFISQEFPPGTREVYVTAGTRLGRQGNYSGTPGNPVGVHLHFSIVQDNGQGNWRNELQIGNTQDPSPYFGLALNARSDPGVVPLCRSELEQGPVRGQ